MSGAHDFTVTDLPGKRKLAVAKFPSWYDFVMQAKDRQSTLPKADQLSRERGSTNYFGTETFEEAVKLALGGWPEGVEKAKKLSGVVFERTTSLVKHPVFEQSEDFGIMFDVATYVQGDPEYWVQMHDVVEEAAHGVRILRLVYNVATTAGISADTIIARGATVAALVNLLEVGGYNVEVEVVDTAAYLDWRMEVQVAVKAADQYLDLNTLAFAMAHPAMLRRLSFSVQEGFPKDALKGLRIGETYGEPCPAINQGDLYISEASAKEMRWQDPDATQDWVLRQLRAQGVVAEEEEAA